MWDTLLTAIQQGDHRSLARAISLVENSSPGYEQLMKQLPVKDIPLIGITGAPGAGKSTLVDALIERAVDNGLQVAVLCIDPSSPFHRGALLGDRIRMSKWYSHKNVFIRSLASRGALGGLHPRIIEICEIIQSAPFNIVIIETIGVGQNEVEIAGLADCTVVVTVPESGDEIQTMKAGVMEIADLFVVNKADRPSADQFIRSLEAMLAPAFTVGNKTIPVLKTIGTQKSGIEELYQALLQCLKKEQDPEKKAWLLTERAYRLIEQQRMKHIDKMELNQRIAQGLRLGKFNLYQFVQPYLTGI